MASSFIVNKADLAFILKQIQVSDLHAGTYGPAMSLQAAIQQIYGLSPTDAALSPFGLRTVDGQDNNLLPGQGEFGAADNPFPRLTDPIFRNDADGDTIDFGGGPVSQGNYGQAGDVIDADPRLISNLIVNMTVDNPAAIAAWFNNPLSLAQFEADHPGMTPVRPGGTLGATGLYITNEDLASIPNQSPDIGLSPGFNAWMTFFGQFFDHGLDLVTKGGNGTVYVPLAADDPLIAGADGILADDPGTAGDESADNLPAHLQFMALTRATVTLDANGVPQHENTTTSFVDQNQTYTSHASHQVFLREYELDASGNAISTGRLLDGQAVNGSLDAAIGNWAEVKAQALEMLGIILDDFDVHNVPLLKTDQYGKFIPGPNGYAQIVMAPDATHSTNWFKEGTAAGITTEGSIGTGHAFLNDIGHHAAPGYVDLDHNGSKETKQTADIDVDLNGDGTISDAEKTADDGDASTYDNELLDLHFATGDGRGNENIALTTVHSIFHSEHNRLVEANKATILQAAADGDIDFLNEWLLVDVAAVPANTSSLVWDGERLFQAARFVTEMQYQHLVFEEFARRVQPMVDPFIFTQSADVDPSILAEFAHVVYRFGHSMLTGTVDRLDNDLTTVNGDADQATLIEAFLNPEMYIGTGLDLDAVNGAIIRGLTRDVGNEMDEFIVSDVRSNLLGLPLDLAVLNLARGRDTGVPPLNEVRRQLYEDFGAADLKPYTSWVDFAQHIKNPVSIVNFIAAYGTHSLIDAETTTAGKRAAAMEIVMGTDQGVGDPGVPADRLAFLNGTGAYAANLGGLNNVDLWIGGLAEELNEFGGMLGSTFNFVFEYQMEHLQNGDRLYYLGRTQGTNLLNQLEPNSFTDLVMRNTDLGDLYSTHLNGSLFTTPDYILELDPGIAQEGADPVHDDPFLQAIDPRVVRILGTDANGDGHYEGGTLKVSGGEHYVLGGTEGADKLYGDKGIDTLWGDGGNDYLNAGMESDDVFGGEGDDIIEDPFGDDVLRGNQGNDVITGGVGADLLFGDQGKDYIILGQDAAEAFGGTDGDFMLGGVGKDFMLGNEGDDWMEGGDGFDTLAGENSELFFNSLIKGHDVLWGQGNDQDYDAESGDDIMYSGPGIQRFEGMFGFDWAIAKYDPNGGKFDMQVPVFTNIPTDILKDRFDQVEAASGWIHNDVIDGDDRGHSGGSSSPDSVPVELFVDHTLDQEGMDRISGLQQLLGGTSITSFKNGNILIGGDGNDTFRGRGGFDTIDGDAWLNVRIKIDMGGGLFYSAESMNTDPTVAGANAGKVFNEAGAVQFGGRSLNSLMLDGTINPGQLSIVREIKYDDTNVTGVGMNIDTAIYHGNLAEYVIEGRIVNPNGTVQREAFDVDGDGFIKVQDLDTGLIPAPGRLVSRGALTDDTDLLKNIERLVFADRTVNIVSNGNTVATGSVIINDPTPFTTGDPPVTYVTAFVGQVLVPTAISLYDRDNDANGDGDLLDAGDTPITNVRYEWQTTEAGNDGGWATIQTSATYTVRPVDPVHVLRAVAVFEDAKGTTERINSAQTENVNAPFTVAERAVGGTVVADAIPFNVDYDPLVGAGAGAGGGDGTTFNHDIQSDPTGYFEMVNVGGTFVAGIGYVGGVDKLVVRQGAEIDYEDPANPDHQYQVVVRTHDEAGNFVADRQFTVLVSDVAENFVNGTPGNDNLTGTPGIDIFTGGAGTDALAGGLGNDEYRSTLTDGVDTITETGGIDRIVVLTGGAALSSFTVLETGNSLQIHMNGTAQINVAGQHNGAGAVVESVNFRGASYLGYALNGDYALSTDAVDPRNDAIAGRNSILTGDTSANTLVGNTGNDLLFGHDNNDNLAGGAGNDLLVGGIGNDILDGGLGADVMSGGAGDDVYVVDNVGDVVNELTGPGGTSAGGSDRVDTTLAAYTIGASQNNLRFTGTGNFAGTGDATQNTIEGGASNDTLLGLGDNDTLVGNGGNDLLDGGTGNDAMTGGLGNDTYVVDSASDSVTEANVVGMDTVRTTLASYTLGANVENLIKTNTGNFTGTGNALANMISGNTGNDTLTGADGNDLLFGGAGNDTIGGGNNDDLVDGGVGNDILNGNAGIDTIIGGAGNDTINVADGNDVVRYNSNGFGTDTISNFDATAAGGQDVIDLSAMGITAANLGTRVTESALAGGGTTLTVRDAAGAVTGIIQVSGVLAANIDANDYVLAAAPAATPGATAAADTLTGTAGNNIMSGLGGNDIVNSLAGDDTIIWNANAPAAATDGRDIVNGGTEGMNGDAFVVNGNANAEAFGVYTRAAWDALAGNDIASLNAATEIVITRNGSNFASVIGELNEIEEIRINGFDPAGASGSAGAGDTFAVSGDFSTTSLRLNTITIGGSKGNDQIDITGLSSDHRVIFSSDGGSDSVVGSPRPQDVFDFSSNAAPATGSPSAAPTRPFNGRSSNDRSSSDRSPPGSNSGLRSAALTNLLALLGTDPTGISVEDLIAAAASLADGISDRPHNEAVVQAPAGPGADIPSQAVLDSLQNLAENGSGDAQTAAVGAIRSRGTAGDDVMNGSDAAERMIGRAGADTLNGAGGADLLRGGRGNDKLNGDAGSDKLRGGSGDDELNGGANNDTLWGNAGDDRLNGGAGDDRLIGGNGDDLFTMEGHDTVVDFEVGEDRIDLSARGITAATFGTAVVITASGEDTLVTVGADTMLLLGVNSTTVSATSFLLAGAAPAAAADSSATADALQAAPVDLQAMLAKFGLGDGMASDGASDFVLGSNVLGRRLMPLMADDDAMQGDPASKAGQLQMQASTDERWADLLAVDFDALGLGMPEESRSSDYLLA